jgi:enoyl-CoA hydratase/carnithine racemase
MTEPYVRFTRDGDIARVTLDRPERLNAIHLAMRDELWTVFTALRDDPTVRCVVIEGAGDRAFSAGADITEFGTAPSLIDARNARLNRDLWGELSRLPVPLVAAIHGFAYGAGLELSLYCDLRIAAEDARFALPEVTLGYIPSAGGTQTAPRHLHRSDALLMAMSGLPLDAHDAYARGLVHEVVPREQLEERAIQLAQRIAALPAAAVRATKRAVRDGLDLTLADALLLEGRLGAQVRLARDAA